MRTVFWLSLLALATLVIGPLQWVAVKTRLWRTGLLPRLWHRVVAKTLGFRIAVKGTPTVERPLLIASNHISWTDITVLGSVVEIVFVAKAETEHWPFIGWLTRMQRTIYVEREKRGRSSEQADELAERLTEGVPVVLFPEGTTGDGNQLLRFNTSLFGAPAKLARDTEKTVWIQPVAIAYTRLHGLPMGRQGRPLAAWIGDQDFVSHLRDLLSYPAIDVELHFGEPIPFAPHDDRKAVARVAEARVQALFQDALNTPAVPSVALRQKAVEAAS